MCKSHPLKENKLSGTNLYECHGDEYITVQPTPDSKFPIMLRCVHVPPSHLVPSGERRFAWCCDPDDKDQATNQCIDLMQRTTLLKPFHEIASTNMWIVPNDHNPRRLTFVWRFFLHKGSSESMRTENAVTMSLDPLKNSAFLSMRGWDFVWTYVMEKVKHIQAVLPKMLPSDELKCRRKNPLLVAMIMRYYTVHRVSGKLMMTMQATWPSLYLDHASISMYNLIHAVDVRHQADFPFWTSCDMKMFYNDPDELTTKGLYALPVPGYADGTVCARIWSRKMSENDVDDFFPSKTGRYCEVVGFLNEQNFSHVPYTIKNTRHNIALSFEASARDLYTVNESHRANIYMSQPIYSSLQSGDPPVTTLSVDKFTVTDQRRIKERTAADISMRDQHIISSLLPSSDESSIWLSPPPSYEDNLAFFSKPDTAPMFSRSTMMAIAQTNRDNMGVMMHKMFQYINHNICLVMFEKYCLVRVCSDDSDLDRVSWCLKKYEDIKASMNIKLIPVDKSGKEKAFNVMQAWFEWGGRRLINGTVFRPDCDSVLIRSNMGMFFNFWSGIPFSREVCKTHAESGTYKMATRKITNHILEIICLNCPEKYFYFVNWLAQLFQFPHLKHETMMILKGDQGIGKTIIIAAIAKAFGKYAHTITDATRAMGNFNAQLYQKVFCHVEECVFASDKDQGAIKNLISNTKYNMEQKHKDAIETTTHHSFIATTNETKVCNAKRTPRRYAIFSCSLPNRLDSRRERTRYFDDLVSAMGVEDDYEGFKAWLYVTVYSRPIPKSWNCGRVLPKPLVEELSNQRRLAISPVEMFLHHVVIDGRLGHASVDNFAPDSEWPNTVTEEMLYKAYQSRKMQGELDGIKHVFVSQHTLIVGLADFFKRNDLNFLPLQDIETRSPTHEWPARKILAKVIRTRYPHLYLTKTVIEMIESPDSDEVSALGDDEINDFMDSMDI